MTKPITVVQICLVATPLPCLVVLDLDGRLWQGMEHGIGKTKDWKWEQINLPMVPEGSSS